MVNALLSIVTAALILTSGSTGQASEGASTDFVQKLPGTPQNQAPAIAAGTYVGTIPCADCEGILVELTLKEAQGGEGKSFYMKQTFLANAKSRNTSMEMEGKWFAAKGNSQNPKAVLLQLIPSNSKYDPTFFVQVNKKQLKMLDRQQNEIKSKGKQNYTLVKQ